MRILPVGLAVAVVAVAAAVLWTRHDSRSDLLTRFRETRQTHDRTTLPEIRVIVDRNTFDLLMRPRDIDPGIAFMSCGITEQEPTTDGRFLLTEECVWKNGRVERRRFPGVRVEDGTSYGWMIHPEDDA